LFQRFDFAWGAVAIPVVGFGKVTTSMVNSTLSFRKLRSGYPEPRAAFAGAEHACRGRAPVATGFRVFGAARLRPNDIV
jgi:hypothetical protein